MFCPEIEERGTINDLLGTQHALDNIVKLLFGSLFLPPSGFHLGSKAGRKRRTADRPPLVLPPASLLITINGSSVRFKVAPSFLLLSATAK